MNFELYLTGCRPCTERYICFLAHIHHRAKMLMKSSLNEIE